MSSQFVDFPLPSDFDNRVSLFPLPKLVLFPGVVQTLHIFEPRYREMTADSLNSDRLMALGMLYPDRLDESGNPKVAQTIGIGRIMSETRLPDGRYTFYLVGIKRAQILTELTTEKPYRIAEVKVIDEPDEDEQLNSSVRGCIADRFRELAELNHAWDEESFQFLTAPEVPFGRMLDMMAYSAGLDSENQQLVLETFDVEARAALVVRLIEDQIEFVRQTQAARRDFPPKFSLN